MRKQIYLTLMSLSFVGVIVMHLICAFGLNSTSIRDFILAIIVVPFFFGISTLMNNHGARTPENLLLVTIYLSFFVCGVVFSVLYGKAKKAAMRNSKNHEEVKNEKN